MTTLVLRFAAPLQSWGTDSRFETRRTDLYPTKSGIIGFLASALGRRRDEDISDLNQLEIGIRVDQPGEMIKDFQFAQGKNSYTTVRYYLSDAVFLVCVGSENKEIIEELKYAILHPVFPLFLGRRSCVPSQPIFMGIKQESVEETLYSFRYLGSRSLSNVDHLIIVESINNKNGITRRVFDEPVSFDIRGRKYVTRLITEQYVPIEQFSFKTKKKIETNQDVFKEVLGGKSDDLD